MDSKTFEEITSPEFDGRFWFTNPTEEDFKPLWNNREYLFPAKKTVAMLIYGESPENTQEIRKRFAYRLAEREFFKGKEYKRLVKLGGANGATFDQKLLEPVIEQCLKPMPVETLKVRKAENKLDTPDDKFRATMAIGENDDPNYEFREKVNAQKVRKYGKMSDK